MTSWTVGNIEVTRVEDPGFELVLPQDESTTAALAASPWLGPHFVTDDLALRIGSSATVVRTPENVVLVDPFLAFGGSEDLGARLQALRDAGVEADDVDVVINSHVDHIGVNLLADGTLTFPRARYLFPAAELDSIRAGEHPEAAERHDLLELHSADAIEASEAGHEVAPGVQLQDAPGHNPGHHVVWVRDGDEQAVVIGHLFLHPAQIAAPEVTTGDRNPEQLVATRRAILERCAAEDALLVGPLFAAPGGGRVRLDGDAWRLEV